MEILTAEIGNIAEIDGNRWWSEYQNCDVVPLEVERKNRFTF